MKKRSQSFLRIKTQHSEDNEDNTQWMGRLASKQTLNKDKHTTSIMDFDKQNSQINVESCESIYERASRNSFSEKANPQLVSALQQKCKKYEKQLAQFYQQCNRKKQHEYHSLQNEGHTLRELRYELEQKSIELEQYRKMYAEKQEQVQGLNYGISSRIEKQQCEKNVLIKEINSNNIEIKRLRDQLQLLKSQKDTLLIVLKEKDEIIEDSNRSNTAFENQRKKIQTYEAKLRESHSELKEIEMQIQKYRTETNKKDQIIQDTNKKVQLLQDKIVLYEGQMKQLEVAVLSLKEDSTGYKNSIQQLQAECQEWKTSYYQTKQLTQTIPDLQLQIKNYQSTIQSLQTRNRELISTNQKLKLDGKNHKSLQKRIKEFEEENTQYRKQLRQKQEELQQQLQLHFSTRCLQQEVESLRLTVNELTGNLHKKQEQSRKSSHALHEKQVALGNLQQEFEETKQENIKLKQRQQKIDIVHAQNKKLHDNLIKKIEEIEDLQKRVNQLQSKNISLTNQNSKNKNILQVKLEEVAELETKFENMKNRFENQVGCRIEFQEKCIAINKQLIGVRSYAKDLEQELAAQQKYHKQISQNSQQQKQELFTQISTLQTQKQQLQQLCQKSQKSIQKLSETINHLKAQISEQIFKQNDNLLKIRELESKIVALLEERNLEKLENQQYEGLILQYTKQIEMKTKERNRKRNRINQGQ